MLFWLQNNIRSKISVTLAIFVAFKGNYSAWMLEKTAIRLSSAPVLLGLSGGVRRPGPHGCGWIIFLIKPPKQNLFERCLPGTVKLVYYSYLNLRQWHRGAGQNYSMWNKRKWNKVWRGGKYTRPTVVDYAKARVELIKETVDNITGGFCCTDVKRKGRRVSRIIYTYCRKSLWWYEQVSRDFQKAKKANLATLVSQVRKERGPRLI